MTRNPAGLILALLLFAVASCAGNSGQPEEMALQAIHVEDGHDHEIDPSTLIRVKMRPAQPVELPFSESQLQRSISSPRGLLDTLPVTRGSSFLEKDLQQNGADYQPALPSANTGVDLGDPAAARFSPDWPAMQGEGVAFCIYRFALEDYGVSEREQTLGLDWTVRPASGDLYIGLANLALNRWEFYMGEDDNVLSIPSYGPCEDPADGSVLVAVVVLGESEVVLRGLQVGAFELRGTGGDEQPFSPPAPDFPDFPLQTLSIVDLSDETGPVLDQGSVASCTAFAATGAYNFELAQLYGDCGWDLELPAFRLSPRYLYIMTGSSLEACPSGGRGIWGSAQWMADNGMVREVTAPYKTMEFDADLGYSFYGFHCSMSWDGGDEATETAVFVPNPVPLLQTIDPVTEDSYLNDAQINWAKAVLKILHRPLGMNTRLDSNFGSVDYAGGESWTFSGTQSGSLSHAMLIVGYDDNRNGGSFKVKNQYGTDWGDEGYCWITYASMQDDASNAYAYYVTDSFSQAIFDNYCPVPPPFLPPFDLKSPTLHNDMIELEWGMVDKSFEYQIFRDGQESPIAVVSSDNTTYQDRGVEDDFAHVYWVRALHGPGPGPFSEPLIAWRDPEA